MAEDRIDSVIDQEKVNAEISDLDKGLLKLLDRINEFKDVKITLGNAKDLGGVNDAQRKVAKGQDELSLSMKEYGKIQDQIAQKQAKLNAMNSDAGKELEQLKIQEQKLNAERKDSVKLMEAQEGSINQLRVQLKGAQAEYDALSKAERNAAGGTELLKKIEAMDSELKQLEGSTGRFQRNVGNYQGSAKIIVEALERARQKFTDLNRDAKASPEAISQAGRELNVLQRVVDNPQFLNVAAKFGDASAEAKFFTKALIDLERQGQGNSAGAIELRTALAKLTDEISDTREEVKALSSDTRGFDLFASAVATATAVAQAAAGANELFGNSNEDVAKSIQRLVALQSLANGVQQISEQLTKRGTAANKVYALVQAQVAIFTNAASTSTQKLNAALKLSGIGLLITGLGFLIGKMLGASDSTKKAEEALEKYNIQLENTNHTLDRNIIKIQQQIDLQVELAKQRGKSEQDINNIVVSGLDQQIEKQDEFAKKMNEGFKKNIAAVNIFFLGFNDQSNEALVQFKKLQAQGVTSLEEAESVVNRIENSLTDGVIGKEFSNSSKKRVELILKNAKTVRDAFTVVEDTGFQKELKTQQFKTQQAQKNIELTRKGAAEEAKAALELFKFRTDLAADQERQLGEIDAFAFNARKDHLLTELELRKSIVQAQKNFDLGEIARTRAALQIKGELTGSQENAFASQRILINEKATDDIKKLEEALGRRLTEIRIEQARQRKEDIDQSIEDFREAQAAKAEASTGGLAKDLQDRQQSIERQRLEDRQNALANFNSGATSKEQFTKRLEDIDKGARNASIQNQIIYYKALITLQESFGLDMTEARKALLDAQIALNDAEIEDTTQTAEEKKAILDETNANYISAVQQIAGAFSGVFGAIFEARKNALQEQIDIIDEMKSKEIEAITASGEAAEAKAARIKVIEAKAQSDKEAIARRQREIDRQRAIAEKAFKVFQIATDTSVAINKIKLLIAAAPDPVTKALYTSQLILAIVSGAASLAALIATPIPKFKHGTDNAPAGPGVWGEAGQEMLIDRKGKLKLSPNRASLVQLMGGEQIIPHERTKAIMNSLGMEGLMGQGAMILNLDQSELINKTGQMVNQLKELNDKPPMIIHVARDITTTAWYQQHLKN